MLRYVLRQMSQTWQTKDIQICNTILKKKKNVKLKPIHLYQPLSKLHLAEPEEIWMNINNEPRSCKETNVQQCAPGSIFVDKIKNSVEENLSPVQFSVAETTCNTFHQECCVTGMHLLAVSFIYLFILYNYKITNPIVYPLSLSCRSEFLTDFPLCDTLLTQQESKFSEISDFRFTQKSNSRNCDL